MAAALQATRFSAIRAAPTRIVADLGARRHGYVEIFWFGNPANYQAVALSVSDGAPSVGPGVPVDEIHARQSGPSAIEFATEELQRFRADEAPNTYTVTAPNVSLERFPPIASVFGADADDVRVFS